MEYLLSKAEVRYQPEYICPWAVIVVFSDGFEHAIMYHDTKEDARLTRDKWNERKH